LDTLNDFKGISVWRDRGASVTLCAVYKLIYLLTYLTQLISENTTAHSGIVKTNKMEFDGQSSVCMPVPEEFTKFYRDVNLWPQNVIS